MNNLSNKVKQMFLGLGLNVEQFFAIDKNKLSADYISTLNSPFPAQGRYRKHVGFLDDICSLKALYQYRLKVIVEAFIALSDTMASYNGKYTNSKIVSVRIGEKEKASLRALASNLSYEQIAQIEAIEARSDHDTAAVTDWIKFKVDSLDLFSFSKESLDNQAFLENSLDGFHFGRTSEDVNSAVFALMNRDLFFEHLIPEILSMQEMLISFAKNSTVVSALTHGQPAEPTSISKQVMNTVSAIDKVLRNSFFPFKEKGERSTISFPVKTFGAVGNHSDLCAAYPDINWIDNDKRFVSALGHGLHLDLMTTQAGLFGEYKQIYDSVCTIGRHLLKFCKDFWGWTSLQWFKKHKKQGVKGSSVMPNKYNPWRIEGAIKFLEKAIVQLEYTSSALMDYPFEGDMGRSILMRDIGDDFSKFFIAIARIKEEILLYEVNVEKIEQFLNSNPGIVGGAAQTILKRSSISKDAYREIQSIMINSDGSYCSQEDFLKRLEQNNSIPSEIKEEIVFRANAKNNIGLANELSTQAAVDAVETIKIAKRLLRQ